MNAPVSASFKEKNAFSIIILWLIIDNDSKW